MFHLDVNLKTNLAVWVFFGRFLYCYFAQYIDRFSLPSHLAHHMYFIRSVRFTSTLFVLFTTTTIFTLVSASSAFSLPSLVSTVVARNIGRTSSSMVDTAPSLAATGLRLRGGTTTSVAAGATASDATKPPVSKKMRIQAFDSMRFFLIIQIVLGHFISFANPSPVILKFFSQHNVLVGAFFALSGYVTVRFFE